MSIASEIQRLQQAKASIKTSVWTKWVTIPNNIKLDSYGTYIDRIIAADYSCWTLAYWLESSVWLNWYWNWWLCLQYSEPTDQWAIAAIFTTRWRMSSSNCDYRDFYFLNKKPWCAPVWSSVSCRLVDNYATTILCAYAHKTNKDCFLIKYIYCNRDYWSWTTWYWDYPYYTLWIDFSVPCATCIWSWSWHHCAYWNSDNNPPWDDYVLISWISWLQSCRWSRPATILCTKIVSSDRNNYVWAAVFK